MTTAELFMLLPPHIDYAGFAFHLQFTEHRQFGIGIGYVLTGCHSRKKYKRQAWKDGYWEDKSVNRQISTMFSNYLFFEPLYDNSDRCLHEALQTLRIRMTEYKLLQPDAYRNALHSATILCAPLKLLES
jgi:hypothetical protein